MDSMGCLIYLSGFVGGVFGAILANVIFGGNVLAIIIFFLIGGGLSFWGVSELIMHYEDKKGLYTSSGSSSSNSRKWGPCSTCYNNGTTSCTYDGHVKTVSGCGRWYGSDN